MTRPVFGQCWAAGSTEADIARVLMARPGIIGRARIQPAEAARIAGDLWDALAEVPG